MEQCRQGKSAKWIRNLGKGLALRAGHGGPSSERIGCRRTSRAATAARAGRRVPVGDGLGMAPSGAFPGRRTVDSELVRTRGIDCLIKIKHCDGPGGCSRNVISAQCSECQSEEIQPSAAKPQPRERAWQNQRGKKTLLSLTLVRLCEMT
ncbi:UNVERIFIED_CONTAM: hypothetical protein Scaly_3018600 [Sesamum calycinum]|uniref:Uncharacterized protein n=1 Tax=Sesamum calycinum TaxID=2727403 RepID=A0AAW2KCI4_9LAMI